MAQTRQGKFSYGPRTLSSRPKHDDDRENERAHEWFMTFVVAFGDAPPDHDTHEHPLDFPRRSYFPLIRPRRRMPPRQVCRRYQKKIPCRQERIKSTLRYDHDVKEAATGIRGRGLAINRKPQRRCRKVSSKTADASPWKMISCTDSKRREPHEEHDRLRTYAPSSRRDA